jgi:transposase InsO family protein
LARPRGARSDLERDLLVDAPLDVDAGRLEEEQALDRAGGRGAGIARYDRDACMQRAERQGFIAGKQFQRHLGPPK